jgi:hypothetical protein
MSMTEKIMPRNSVLNLKKLLPAIWLTADSERSLIDRTMLSVLTKEIMRSDTKFVGGDLFGENVSCSL